MRSGPPVPTCGLPRLRRWDSRSPRFGAHSRPLWISYARSVGARGFSRRTHGVSTRSRTLSSWTLGRCRGARDPTSIGRAGALLTSSSARARTRTPTMGCGRPPPRRAPRGGPQGRLHSPTARQGGQPRGDGLWWLGTRLSFHSLSPCRWSHSLGFPCLATSKTGNGLLPTPPRLTVGLRWPRWSGWMVWSKTGGYFLRPI